MKKHIIATLGCIAVALGVAGCAHTSGTQAPGTQKSGTQTSGTVPVQDKQQVLITLGRNGSLYVAGKPCPPNQLTARLSKMGARKAVIQADSQVPFAEVVSVLSACKSAGVEQVSMAPNK